MQGPGTPTLDQLRVFLTVVEAGSFAAAGRRLNRATSVVSYTIANLEAQLGLPLFDRRSTRKPHRLVSCSPRNWPTWRAERRPTRWATPSSRR